MCWLINNLSKLVVGVRKIVEHFQFGKKKKKNTDRQKALVIEKQQIKLFSST